MKKKLLSLVVGAFIALSANPLTAEASEWIEVGEKGRPFILTYDTEEQIKEEIKLGDMELIAQLVEAEAGNQPFEGKCLVVDVILNRLEDPAFPNTVEGVIFQSGQFSVTWNGAFEKAAWNMKDSDFAAVAVEYEMRANKDVLYFNCGTYVANTNKLFKLGGHYFSK